MHGGLYIALGKFSSMHGSDIMICVGYHEYIGGVQGIGRYPECIGGVQCTGGYQQCIGEISVLLWSIPNALKSKNTKVPPPPPPHLRRLTG